MFKANIDLMATSAVAPQVEIALPGQVSRYLGLRHSPSLIGSN